ncbi:MAG: DNA/RNA non-specific endonuclease [Spirochaetes bacterium]|nr:DNA/RNA non-specific endonuclease [Spirochaetota bacterium]
MKYILSFAVLFFLSSALNASEHAYGGIPSKGDYIKRKAYIIQFDAMHKTPRWVAYHVKPSNAENLPDRKIKKWGKFRDDSDINNEATEKDYSNQFKTWRNYAKGHLAPYYISGGDRDNDGITAAEGDKDDAEAVYEIMYMSNMAPQHHSNFNGPGGLWYKLESYVRDDLLKKQRKEVWVFAGCIFGPRSYDRIGDGVEVPPMFFKIIITEEKNKPRILAFFFPHQINKHGDIEDFLVSVNIIEAMTGLDFFPEINDEKMERESTWVNWINNNI